MSDPQRDSPYDPEPVRKESHTNGNGDASAMDDRGGFRDTAPNPHDEAGTEQTAARATGAITGMFFPVVIVAIVAIVVILYFVL
jgi:hypothetical protein